MTRPQYTLAVVTTADGFIAKAPGHDPSDWASPEEQALFLATVDTADWAVMGRGTHEVADRPDRRRVVFSSSAKRPEWRRPTQLWIDPEGQTPDDLPGLVETVHPLSRALILGGTKVHDWFHAAGRIDEVLLTVEPVSFGHGLPLLTGQSGPAGAVLARNGYRLESERKLNDAGTVLYRFLRD